MTLTAAELRALRSILARAQGEPPTAAIDAPPPIAPGDVVQLLPDSCAVFGGMLMQIGQLYSPYEIRGWLLRPHRGGCREAWHRCTPSDVARIGRPLWPAPEFARRLTCPDAPRCRLTAR